MARRGMGLDSVVRAKILTSGISLSFVLWWWSKQPSPAQKVGGKWRRVLSSPHYRIFTSSYLFTEIYYIRVRPSHILYEIVQAYIPPRAKQGIESK